LSKEGLQSVVDDKDQVNALSTKDLRNLFKLRAGTPSDTHDKLRCERCEIIHDNEEIEAKKVLPKKLAACKKLLEELVSHEDAQFFTKPLVAEEHGKTKEEYEKLVKQPMDLGTIGTKLDHPLDNPSAYSSVSSFSKDVNRIFSNVVKVWSPGDDIADASRRLQTLWCEKWTDLVPELMKMKSDDEATLETNLDDPLEACANLHNDRGDDYQEQIGMPDEEDMRQWSHHHSVDTVDDPVFRAALRGRDVVSFVFGLEVTWVRISVAVATEISSTDVISHSLPFSCIQSLIQERQQEEEERIALEALEMIEEENAEQALEEELEDSKPAAREKAESEGEPVADCRPDDSVMDDDEVDDVAASNDTSGDEEEENASVGADDVCEEPAPQKHDSPNKSSSPSSPESSVESAQSQSQDDDSDSKESEQHDGPNKSSSPSSPESSVESGQSQSHSQNDDSDSNESEQHDGRNKSSLSSPDSSVESGQSRSQGDDSGSKESETQSSEEDDAPTVEIAASVEPPKKKTKTTKPMDLEDDPSKENSKNATKGASKSSAGVWACSACTFHNSLSLRKCQVCGARKPSSSRR
jgi:hypothetical protein